VAISGNDWDIINAALGMYSNTLVLILSLQLLVCTATL